MTRALDTNIVVRVLADPLSSQYPAAAQAMRQSFAVPVTVFLESEWVLRSYFRWGRDEIVAGLRSLLDLPALAVQPPGLTWAIDRYAEGADFANMIHLIAADGAAAFATFDEDVARRAGPDAPIPIETLA
jgi:predicted nucleic-acid-binding protein